MRRASKTLVVGSTEITLPCFFCKMFATELIRKKVCGDDVKEIGFASIGCKINTYFWITKHYFTILKKSAFTTANNLEFPNNYPTMSAKFKDWPTFNIGHTPLSIKGHFGIFYPNISEFTNYNNINTSKKKCQKLCVLCVLCVKKNINRCVKPCKTKKGQVFRLTPFSICGLLVWFYFFAASARAINLSISRPSVVIEYFSLISL